MGQFRQPVTNSEFYMWRAVFAFAFVDNSLSIEEQELLKSYLNSVPFSADQLKTLKDDFQNPPDVVHMYSAITNQKHREHFCVLARALVWCEGNMDRQEKEILKRVSCLRGDEGAETLRHSREHAHTFYRHYAKAGVTGLMRRGPNFEVRV
jgi:hypothetical protein